MGLSVITCFVVSAGHSSLIDLNCEMGRTRTKTSKDDKADSVLEILGIPTRL